MESSERERLDVLLPDDVLQNIVNMLSQTHDAKEYARYATVSKKFFRLVCQVRSVFLDRKEVKSFEMACKWLKKMTNLSSFHLILGNDADPTDVLQSCRLLRQIGPGLRELTLEFTLGGGGGGRSCSPYDFGDVIISHCRALNELVIIAQEPESLFFCEMTGLRQSFESFNNRGSFWSQSSRQIDGNRSLSRLEIGFLPILPNQSAHHLFCNLASFYPCLQILDVSFLCTNPHTLSSEVITVNRLPSLHTLKIGVAVHMSLGSSRNSGLATTICPAVHVDAPSLKEVYVAGLEHLSICGMPFLERLELEGLRIQGGSRRQGFPVLEMDHGMPIRELVLRSSRSLWTTISARKDFSKNRIMELLNDTCLTKSALDTLVLENLTIERQLRLLANSPYNRAHQALWDNGPIGQLYAQAERQTIWIHEPVRLSEVCSCKCFGELRKLVLYGETLASFVSMSFADCDEGESDDSETCIALPNMEVVVLHLNMRIGKWLRGRWLVRMAEWFLLSCQNLISLKVILPFLFPEFGEVADGDGPHWTKDFLALLHRHSKMSVLVSQK